MTPTDLDSNEAISILTRLQNGVPPDPEDTPNIRVGREAEVNRLCEKPTEGLPSVANGAGDLFFVLGDFGYGKSFFINFLAYRSEERNFIRSEFDIQDIEDLSDKADLYTGVVSNIRYPDARGKGLVPLLRQFCEEFDVSSLNEIASTYGMVGHPFYTMLRNLLEAWSKESIYVEKDDTRLDRTEVLGAVAGYLSGEEIGLAEKHAIGKKGVGTIRKETENLYDYLRHIRSLALALDYDGFVVLIDEAAEQLDWSSDTNTTQRLIDLYNRCYKSDEFEHMMFVFVGNEEKWKGLIEETGHQALSDRFHAKKIVLGDLDRNNYIELVQRVARIVEVANDTDRRFTEEEAERLVDQAADVHGGIDGLSPRDLLVFPNGQDDNSTLIDLLQNKID